MNTRGLLDQLLKSGNDYLSRQTGGAGKPLQTGQGGTDPLSGMLSGAAGGALAAGAMSLLMGSKKARKVTGNVAMYGGLAALGVVAYKAYDNWQKNQSAVPVREPQTVDRLTGPQVEEHSQAILRALIGAAKSDGHIDERERTLIDGEIAKLGDDPALTRWFDQELKKPLDPAEVASAATTPEMAAEMYAASVLMVDEDSFMERAYLQELARQLQLEQGLVKELEQQARQYTPRA